MCKRSLLPNKKIAFLMFGFLGVMLVIGTFFDYNISKFLVDPTNIFGIVGACFGEYPVSLGCVAAGTMIWCAKNKNDTFIKVLQCILGTFLIIMGALVACLMPTLYGTLPIAAFCAIGIICCALVMFFTVKLCKNADSSTILRVAAIIVLAFLAEAIIINIIKIPWSRPRMRLLEIDPRAYFIPWWQPNPQLKNELVASGVLSEEFKSFPSGHSGNAAILILIGLLPQLCQKLESKKTLLISIGFVYAFTIALSRIIMGAHFLTDTVVAITISTCVMMLLSKLILNKKTPIQKLKK